MEKILEVNNISGGYGSIQILNGIDLTVYESEFVTIIGPNGCGKSTFIKVIFGIANLYQGDIIYRNEDITGMRADSLVKKGIGYVPQTDNVFPSLTVEENLQTAFSALPRNQRRIDPEVFALFPVLQQMLKRRGGDLSGGQQQQLAIARALLLKPKLLILDEPTEGIQPSIIKDIQHVIELLRDRGEMAIVLVEQYLDFAAELADDFIILERGRVVAAGAGHELKTSEQARELLAI